MTPNESYKLKVDYALEVLLLECGDVEIVRDHLMTCKVLLKYPNGEVRVYSGKDRHNAIERAARAHTTVFDK
jgi:hypothetical protein